MAIGRDEMAALYEDLGSEIGKVSRLHRRINTFWTDEEVTNIQKEKLDLVDDALVKAMNELDNASTIVHQIHTDIVKEST